MAPRHPVAAAQATIEWQPIVIQQWPHAMRTGATQRF